MSPQTPPSGAGTSTRRRCWSATYASVKVGSLRGLRTGIMLYCLADATWGYVVDMYLYTGVQGRLRRYGTAAGNFDSKDIMKLWASLLPEGTVLCANCFFGSHGLAKELAAN